MYRKIEQLNNKKLIAIEGEPASGKTTLAVFLQKEINANVVSIDDFYLPIEKRNKSTFEKGGNNIDYERLIKEVIQKHIQKEIIQFRRYDCQKNQYTDTIVLKPKPTLIIEGSYSLGRQISKYFDFKILIEVNSKTQLSRLKERLNYQDFINRWIPLSRDFIEENLIKEIVDVIES
jgi:uridine kinase